MISSGQNQIRHSQGTNLHFKVIKSKKTTKEKIKKWFINHIHPQKRLPIIRWLPKYKLNYIKGDIISGISVGLLIVPQSLAIAGIFGCLPIVGLYSSMAGPFSSIFFSTSPDNSVGPTLLVALVGSRFNPYGLTIYMSMMSFFSGILMILLSFFNAGVLMNFVSFTVLSAFISCGCLSIAISQLPGMFGIVIENSGLMNAYQLAYHFFSRIYEAKYQDISIGFTCIIVGLFCHYTMKCVRIKQSKSITCFSKFIWETIWLLYVAKNALLTIIMTLVAYILVKYNSSNTNLTLTGKLEAGFPTPWFPIQSVTFIRNNKNITLSSLDIMSQIYPSFFLAPIMMFVETLAIVKNFSKQKDYTADYTQELLNVGVANIINSFFRGYPIGGAIARSTLNSLSGVNTCLSGIITIIVVVLSLMVLTPLLYYTPRAALSGMIIAAVIPSIDICKIKLFWQVQKWELVPWFGTMIIGLYRLELGMATGLALSSGFILFREMRPRLHRIHHIHRDRGTFSVRLRSGLHFPCAVFITDRIKSFIKKYPELTELEIDCHAMHEIDITVAKELLEIVDKLKQEKHVHVKFSYVKPGTVKHIMSKVGLDQYIYNDSQITAQDCRHCHSYHNHINVSGNLNTKNIVADNMDTTRSAPPPLAPNKLAIIHEKSHNEDIIQKPLNNISNMNLTDDQSVHINITTTNNNNSVIHDNIEHIHSSNSESSSSSSGTDNSSLSSNDG